MQIWRTYYENEIESTLLKLSQEKVKPAIVVTTAEGEVIPLEMYDAVASHGKNGAINAFLRFGKLFVNGKDYFYDLEHTQLYLRDIKEIAVCEKWIPEFESPEDGLAKGMNVRITRADTDDVCAGEIKDVAFLDVVVNTAEGEVFIPANKIRSVTIL